MEKIADIKDISIPHWVIDNQFINERGEVLEFRDRLFLYDILADISQYIVLKKSAQIGATVTFTLKAYFVAQKGRMNVIYCVDEKTEILSKRGWLEFNELKLDDLVLSLSSKDGLARFSKLKEIFIKDVEMPLMSFEGRNFSALTTFNHRWLVRKEYGIDDKLFFEISENLSNKFYLIPRIVKLVQNKKSKYDDNFIKLLAWIFTEGYYEKIKGQNSYRIIITQSYRVNYDKVLSIRKILEELDIPWKEHKSSNGCINFYLKGEIIKKIKDTFPDKLPTIDFVNSLTKKHIGIFIDTLIAGDGWIDQWGTKNIIQKNKKFIDIVSYASVLAGYVPRINQNKGKDKCWYLKLINFDYIWTEGLSPKTINYKGKIWCPRTEYGTFYARREGHCYWTGNTMPSDSDVSEFVKTKADMIFQSNELLRSQFSSDTVGLKKIGDRFIYYKGTRSKTAPISTSADLLIHDEVDRSDLGIIEKYRSRLSASPYKGIWYLSNPSLVGVGVDEIWQKSDKKEWFIRCQGCGEEQNLIWEENVDEIRKIYVCKKCGKEITDDERRKGKWIATNPGKEISGYHISQMMAPWLSAKDLIKEKEDRGEEYFRNFVLGEPYGAGAEANIRQAIYDVWTPKVIDVEPYFMGIDIGIEKHYCIGSREGIFKIGVCKSREDMESVIEKYNPVWVMDAGPERTWAEEFRKKYPKGFLNFYRKDKPKAEIIKWGGYTKGVEDKKNWGYIWSDRTRIIDKTIYEILKGNIQFSLTREDLEKYIKHWESMRRIIEKNPDGTESYIWQTTTGQDHWCHATVYYYIAMQRGMQKMEFIPEAEGKKEIIERTSEGFKMKPLKEIIESQQQEDEE